MAASRFRWAWWLLAWAALGLGLVGIVVPGLPTVPFVLLSAYAAARGSERLHAWLLAHPRFGPMIRDWQAQGAVRNMITAHAAIITIANRLARRLTAPCACQSRIIGPNRRCASSRACNRCEPRAAA